MSVDTLIVDHPHRHPKAIGVYALVMLLPAIGACVTSPAPPVVVLPVTPPPTTFPTIVFPAPEPPNMAPPLALPDRPPDSVDMVTFTVAAREATEPDFEKSASIPRGRSIVINFPSEVAGGSADPPNLFTTRNHHNVVEDVLERQIMANGLSVKDRSKFEAIVRDLRATHAGCNAYSGLAYRSDIISEVCFDIGDLDSMIPDIQPLPEGPIETSMEDRIASMQDYIEYRTDASRNFIPRLLRLRAESAMEYRRQTGLALQFGKHRNDDEDDEIGDLPDLLRATGVYPGADYILIVNALRVENEVFEVPLRASPEFRALDPAVRERILHQHGGRLSCHGMEASVSAKLIEVTSGRIVWTGTHTVTSLDDVPIELEVTHVRGVSNYDDIVAFVESQNRGSRRIERYGQTTRIPPFEYGARVDLWNRSPTTCNQTGEARGGSDRDRRALAVQAAAELIRTVPN